MLGDIAIMVFALISIFTKKKWAIITSTIWFIISLVIGVAIGFVVGETSNLTIYGENIPQENIENMGIVLLIFEAIFIIIGWIRVLTGNKKSTID